jgi:MoxR-like ATPase
MDPIKIQVSVELNLSDDAKKFIASCVSNVLAPTNSAATVIVEEKKPEAKPAAKPVATTATVKPAEAAEAKPVVTISIDDVRKALASKVANHRSEIKEKLEELGAPSVTKLDKAKYQEMLDYLNALD